MEGKKEEKIPKKLEFLIAKTPEQLEEFRAMQTTCYITGLGQPAKYVHKHFDDSVKAMGYIDGKPVCSGLYVIDKDGTAFTNMACVYKKYRGKGHILKLLDWTLEFIAKDPNVKNKEECFSEARLEMIPNWTKKRKKDFRTVEKQMGENGLE